MATFVNETFNTTEGSVLNTYNPSWVKLTGLAGNQEIASNRLRNSVTGSCGSYHTGAPAGADYHAKADLAFISSALATQPGVAVRASTSAATYYLARYNSSTGEAELYKFVAAAATLLANVAVSFSVGETKTLAIEAIGTAVRVYWDGAPVIRQVDTDISAAGQAAQRISITGTPSDSNGIHMDNFLGIDGPFLPTITGPGSATGLTSSVSIAENTTAVHTFTANESVTWDLNGGADVALFTINSSTGALAFSSAPDFEAPGDADTNNTYIVGVRATGANGAITQTCTVTVTNVGEGGGSTLLPKLMQLMN